mgnify:CR=1 FL=1
MEICLGMLHMPPNYFWNMSLMELHTAIDGFMEINGSKKNKSMTPDELQKLMELYPD